VNLAITTPVLTTPNGGELWSTTHTINWTAALGDTIINTVLIEDFEDANLIFPVTGNWVRTSTAPPTGGTWSYTNADISHAQLSQSIFTLTVPTGATNAKLSFDYLVSSEANCDWFKIFLNDSVQLSAVVLGKG
jgi:hypothetical protein